MKKFLSVAFAVIMLFGLFTISASADEPTYESIAYLELDCTQYENYKLPYYLPSTTTCYSWEITLSDVAKNPNSCGSFVGIYDHSYNRRSGYLYSPTGTSNEAGHVGESYFQVCVGDNHRGTKFYLFNKPKNTIHASYTANTNGYGGTYSVYDTNGLIASKSSPNTGTWSGYYSNGSSNVFGICSCATYNTISSASEFLSMKLYGLKIWEKDGTGTEVLKVDMVPMKKTEDDTVTEGLYDNVSKKFYETTKYSNQYKITFDNQGADAATPGTASVKVATGMKMASIKVPAKTDYSFGGYYTQKLGKGTRYYDETGTSTRTWDIAADTTLYACWHKWAYAAKDDTLYAYCTEHADCEHAGSAADLSKAEKVVIQENASTYDGEQQGATLSYTELGDLKLDASKISYEGTGETTYGPSTDKPVDAGTYKATYTISLPGGGSVSATKEFTIQPATVAVIQADISYEPQEDGSYKPVIDDVILEHIAAKDEPYTAYTTSAVMLDENGKETTDPAKAKSVQVTLTLDETADVNKNYTATKTVSFPLNMSGITLAVTISPSKITVPVGKTATFKASTNYRHIATNFTATSKSSITYTYQWYVDRNDGAGREPIQGATKSSYTTSAVKAENDGYKYYCEVTDNQGHKTLSAPALLRVQTDIPTTGDENMPLLFMGLMLLAGAGLVLIRKRTTK